MIVFDCSRLDSFEYNGLQLHTFFAYIFAHSPGRGQYGGLFDGYEIIALAFGKYKNFTHEIGMVAFELF